MATGRSSRVPYCKLHWILLVLMLHAESGSNKNNNAEGQGQRCVHAYMHLTCVSRIGLANAIHTACQQQQALYAAGAAVGIKP